MRFTLDVPVEKRRIQNGAAVTFDLGFPPSAQNPEACDLWARRQGWEIAAKRPGRVPGPVRITLLFEERSGRRISQDMVEPIIELCDRFNIIDASHRTVVRELTVKWAHVSGVRVTIEPAVTVERRAA